MAVLQAADIADLVAATEKDLGRAKITDLTSDLQEHIAAPRLLQKNKVLFQSGTAVQFQTLMSADTNTRNTGLNDVDNVNQEDGIVAGSCPWKNTTTGYTYDLREFDMNRSPSKIVDFVKVKRQQQMSGFFAKMEENFWGEPDSSTDKTTPFGVKYWIVYNATDGFTGANNSNFSSGPADISRTTYARWKSYNFTYANITKTDLVRKWRKGATLVNFKPPVPNAPVPPYGAGGRYGWYTNYDVLGELEERVEDQNDNLGNDVASKDGSVLFRRVPVTYVPYLQANESTADPIVGIDWSVFSPCFLRGWYMRESPVKQAPLQHNSVQAFMDNTYNFVCYDCRRLVLGAKSTWH